MSKSICVAHQCRCLSPHPLPLFLLKLSMKISNSHMLPWLLVSLSFIIIIILISFFKSLLYSKCNVFQEQNIACFLDCRAAFISNPYTLKTL